MALMDELHAAGRTIVLITHDADVADSAERIVRIRDGVLANPEEELVDDLARHARASLEAVRTIGCDRV